MTSETGAEAEFEYDRSVIGVDVEQGSIEITRERIDNFLEALGETNPIYTDEAVAKDGRYEGVIVPPGMLAALPFGHGGPDPKVRFGTTTMLAGTRVEMLQPIRPGDTLSAKTQVKDVYAKTGRSGTMVFVVRRTTYSNQDGDEVAFFDQSLVHRDIAGG